MESCDQFYKFIIVWFNGEEMNSHLEEYACWSNTIKLR